MNAFASLLIVGALNLSFSVSVRATIGDSLIRTKPEGSRESGNNASASGNFGLSGTEPEELARSFYRWYLKALYRSPNADPLREQKTEADNYLTARLLQKLASSRRTNTIRKGPDVDIEYFFKTLDLDSDWEQGIIISNSTINGPTAIVHVTLSGNADSRQDLRVVLKVETGLWKIDEVTVWGR